MIDEMIDEMLRDQDEKSGMYWLEMDWSEQYKGRNIYVIHYFVTQTYPN